jgi:hypothetical protein
MPRLLDILKRSKKKVGNAATRVRRASVELIASSVHSVTRRGSISKNSVAPEGLSSTTFAAAKERREFLYKQKLVREKYESPAIQILVAVLVSGLDMNS